MYLVLVLVIQILFSLSSPLSYYSLQCVFKPFHSPSFSRLPLLLSFVTRHGLAYFRWFSVLFLPLPCLFGKFFFFFFHAMENAVGELYTYTLAHKLIRFAFNSRNAIDFFAPPLGSFHFVSFICDGCVCVYFFIAVAVCVYVRSVFVIFFFLSTFLLVISFPLSYSAFAIFSKFRFFSLAVLLSRVVFFYYSSSFHCDIIICVLWCLA